MTYNFPNIWLAFHMTPSLSAYTTRVRNRCLLIVSYRETELTTVSIAFFPSFCPLFVRLLSLWFVKLIWNLLCSCLMINYISSLTFVPFFNIYNVLLLIRFVTDYGNISRVNQFHTWRGESGKELPIDRVT